jgi:hypothetical protein
MGLILNTSPHFATTSNSSVVHLVALQIIAPPPPSLESQTLMTLGTLTKKKDLYLNSFGSYRGTMA